MPSIMPWDDEEDDEDDKRPFIKSPAEVGPSVIWWLLVRTTFLVMVPALAGMAFGLWLDSKTGHKQLFAITGTLLGLALAAFLVWRQAKRMNH